MRAAAFVLGVLLCGLAAPGQATTLRHLDLDELTTSSTGIVIGNVLSVRSHWNAAHTRIVTDVDFQIQESLKGGAVERVVISQLGGEVDGVRMSVPGCPAFVVGEEALLFLWSGSPSVTQVTGLEQGKFDIERDPVTGVRYLQRQAPGQTVSDLRGLTAVPGGKPAPRWTVEQMVTEVHASIARGSQGAREQ